MNSIKRLQLISLFSGFLMIACVVMLGGYIAIGTTGIKQKAFKVKSTSTLSKKVITPDSTKSNP